MAENKQNTTPERRQRGTPQNQGFCGERRRSEMSELSRWREREGYGTCADAVTEIRMGNTVLVVSGFFKKDTTDTAADKMMKVLEAEAAAGHKAQLSP